jgi:hypothetical protein
MVAKGERAREGWSVHPRSKDVDKFSPKTTPTLSISDLFRHMSAEDWQQGDKARKSGLHPRHILSEHDQKNATV